jgi:hypothetical protein
MVFLVYITFVVTGIIELNSAERISRHTLGFNGAFLGGIGCISLYNIFKKNRRTKRNLLLGLAGTAIALLFYATTEGIVLQPLLGISVVIMRLFSGIMLFIMCFFFVELLKEEQRDRIDYI